MLSWVRNILDVLSLRRFGGAKTDRLNEAHWLDAHETGNTINDDLSLDLITLRNRTIHEAQNNAFLAGVIETHVVDVVGADGPSLQVQSDDEDYNREIEAGFAEWWEQPELTGRVSGVETLQTDVRMLWQCGEFLDQIVRDAAANESGVQTRFQEIHPRRLTDPFNVSTFDVQLGVKRTREGRPISYFITDFDFDQGMYPVALDGREIPAEQIIHGFKPFEPGQVRGFPLAAPCLQVIADLRDYDTATLRAARIAAEFSVLLESQHPDIEPLVVNETADMEGGVIRTAPPGWKAIQIKPEHPATSYKEFRAERLRELGRPVNMPLMMVLIDASDANFSSARFNGQIYLRGIRCLQQMLTRIKLRRLFDVIEPELRMLRGVRRPRQVTTQWTWPVAPHVDPQKEAQALETLLDLGLISEIEAAAMLGRDYENTLALKARAKTLRENAGIDDAPPADAAARREANEQRRQIERVIEDVLEARGNNSHVFSMLN